MSHDPELIIRRLLGEYNREVIRIVNRISKRRLAEPTEKEKARLAEIREKMRILRHGGRA